MMTAHRMTRLIDKVGSPMIFAAYIATGCGADQSRGSPASPSLPGSGNVAVTITVDTLQRFQTMTGWEAIAQAGQEGSPGFSSWKNALYDQAVNDLGINRIRLETKPAMENPSDYYVRRLLGQDTSFRCERWLSVNDNNDPNVINPAGFHFSQIDSAVAEVVQPIRQRLSSRGEKLFVNLTYTAFLGQCGTMPPYVHADPAEYAEFILATFLHLKNSYGWVPDAVEMILEPDNISIWNNGRVIGQALVATAARLAAAGFRPLYIAPSTADLGHGLGYLNDLYSVPGVDKVLGQLAYHRYGLTSPDRLAALAQAAAVHGASTAMLEHIGSSVDDLYNDLTVAQVSAWEQFTLAFPEEGDNGGKYYMIVADKPVMGDRTRYLRQYFHYVRFGARRVAATSNNGEVRPVAFQNVDGRMAVVMHVNGDFTIELAGLRAGTYGASITNKSSTGAELPESVVGTNGRLRITAPSDGVLTVYQK